ncbi:RecQ family ATP-dependent DNA helicase [Flavobacterium sp. HJ-32-4]|uniref:RecQ family ATP-dependent DNA helicase n=2 Tax=unclassified Flavobacterium TaxID=196869 RepID=UPI001F14324B|nr:RecQ family ATP-dependent DNA helicase [Flavobacterium sp. HJ-32-4]UMY65425.1 RecQ family ATP-dependent DNA helicase [Flavobacterium sp. HJ-32-4]
MQYIKNTLDAAGIEEYIDTLYLSPLFFPRKRSHALSKDEKLQDEERNNPLNDAIKSRSLFEEQVANFRSLDVRLQQIYFLLLRKQPEFQSFFRYLNFQTDATTVIPLIQDHFDGKLCANVDPSTFVFRAPIATAYSLSLINALSDETSKRVITAPWVLKNYPDVTSVLTRLRNRPCLSGCLYCNDKLDVHRALKRHFNFDHFRSYDGVPLQEKAVKAAVDGQSILAIFPTGGGKSVTFQLPALMEGENVNALTVVISPLQSLMKDQVDNLEKVGITSAVTINGLLDPVERAKSYERVENGDACLLYVSPESLRSVSMERLLLDRRIARFVIDEAHCFSSWGQDFRVDYLYIGPFIKSLQEKKNSAEPIPVSCFTATAKQNVIDDIRDYFKKTLQLDLFLYESPVGRKNLTYRVSEKIDEDEKYQALRNLIESKNCPTIVYVSRTRKAEQLAEKLVKDGFLARAYHGKLEAKEKKENQERFINGNIDIMVATSAFGMGVDKKDVGLVVHFEISDSLENYIQEAGRAGRDENMVADCHVLYNEDDLSKHFILLNQTRLTIREIQQVWKAVKDLMRYRPTGSHSALEIARQAGWEEVDKEIETRVTTAVAALEDAGYIRRKQNRTRLFANSIRAKSVQEAIDRITASQRFDTQQKEPAVRILKKLFSSRSRRHLTDEGAESRIDYISDHLGIPKEEVIRIVTLLREEGILSDFKDLTAFVRRGDKGARSASIVADFARLERYLLSQIGEDEQDINIKHLNEAAQNNGCEGVGIPAIKSILNLWAIKKWIERRPHGYSKHYVRLRFLTTIDEFKSKLSLRHELAQFLIAFLHERANADNTQSGQEEVLVEFSVVELKRAYESGGQLFIREITTADIEDTLFYLSRIGALKIEGGFMVIYNRLSLERLETNNKKSYTRDDYQKLDRYYDNKAQQIHIVGEYARKMAENENEALQFVNDYFSLNYQNFVRQYFPGARAKDLRLKMTPSKYRQLFGTLSSVQEAIIKDESQYITVFAGPGSGKTKVLVHKLASLLLMEDVKHEQLLMLTFSRAAATEFKKRLLELIGNAAHFVEIKTFHSYCFDLLGKMGSLEGSENVVQQAIRKIKADEVEASRVTRTVLVIDEAQDMNKDEYELILSLMERNEEMRLIAVGDDDQEIFGFRRASAEYLKAFSTLPGASKHELYQNYRSAPSLVAFAERFAQRLPNRLKSRPGVAMSEEAGKVTIVRHPGRAIAIAVVHDIIHSRLTGTTAVLTNTNAQAAQLAGLLIKEGMNARLIQEYDSFRFFDLREVRFFRDLVCEGTDTPFISDETWEKAKQHLSDRFKMSPLFTICEAMIHDFEVIYSKRKYKSDFDTFVRESKLEDFSAPDKKTIFVSTIHKSKGKEFDNVFVAIVDFPGETGESNRQLYVAITRAKKTLTVHLNSDILQSIGSTDCDYIHDASVYEEPFEMGMMTTHKDLWLDFFLDKQSTIEQLRTGDKLVVREKNCVTLNGVPVLSFSAHCQEKIRKQQERGYTLKTASINAILHWRKEGMDEDTLIVLPELGFERDTAHQSTP